MISQKIIIIIIITVYFYYTEMFPVTVCVFVCVHFVLYRQQSK